MLSFANGEQLAQSRPADTNTASVFTASMRTEITCIVICNTTGSAANASLFHDDDGSTFDQTTALLYAKSVPANDYIILNAAALGYFTIKEDGQLGVQSGTGNALTYTIYGTTEAVSNG